jgi:hypothetical protein
MISQHVTIVSKGKDREGEGKVREGAAIINVVHPLGQNQGTWT